VRLLVDEALSTRVADLLRQAGHDAVHCGDLGLLGRPDTDVLAAATQQQRILVTADTDFVTLVVLRKLVVPSVIVVRRSGHHPGEQASMLSAALPDLEEVLSEGAVVSLSPGRARIRRLPIGPP
jgi:predicted nuclease of predicted toxin-antitoxin system